MACWAKLAEGEPDHQRKAAEADGEDEQRVGHIAHGGAGRQPHQACWDQGMAATNWGDCSRSIAIEAAEAEDGGGLDADDEAGADNAGNDLGDEAGAGGADGAEEADGDADSDCSGEGAEAHQHGIGGEPARTIVHGQHVDDGAGEGGRRAARCRRQWRRCAPRRRGPRTPASDRIEVEVGAL